ncbi:MAG TPA: polymer-forming cytoskeletal protein [Vicinamibacteria bacterium]
MWNKRENETFPPSAETPQAVMASSAAAVAPRREASGGIGPSISIVGDITGEEDLTILGKVKGKIDLPGYNVTVGESGRVEADVNAKMVSVAGEVHGNLIAAEQILVRKTATMFGNLKAPRVGLEDGCCFRGSVDMERPEKGRTASAPLPRVTGPIAPAKPAASVLPVTAAGAGPAPPKPETAPVRP